MRFYLNVYKEPENFITDFVADFLSDHANRGMFVAFPSWKAGYKKIHNTQDIDIKALNITSNL